MDVSQYFVLDQALHQAWTRREARFNAYTFAHWAGLMDKVPEVNSYLLQKVGQTLKARIEFICPLNHPTASIDFGEEIPLISHCHVCGEEFIPSIKESNIVFWFNQLPEIKEVKKKAQVQFLVHS